MLEEIINLTDDEDQPTGPLSRRDILAPAIQHVIAALGGVEDLPQGSTYVLGDECYGCLKDLKRFWRKDDTDDERTVARIFYETAVLQSDLIPIVLQTAGKGDVENRCAIAAVDLMTGMTWPIDVAAELKELDEEEDNAAVDYTLLITAQLNYKRALIANKECLSAIFDLLIPCMAKERWNRTERDKQIVTLVLYLLRNLAFVRDLPINTNLSADQAELSLMQSRYIGILHDTLILDFLLTFASNAIDDPLANAQNTLVLEIFYLLFRSIPPSSILPSLSGKAGPSSSTASNSALRNALDSEFRSGLLQKRHTTSRHSRFGTTIQISSNNTGQSLILHRGAAAIQGQGAGEVLDRGKKKLAKRGKMKDELTGGAGSASSGGAKSGAETRLSPETRENLGNVAKIFVESCFNPFFSSLIKDIRAERSKITEKDNLRLLFLSKFFIQFFLALRERDISQPSTTGTEGQQEGETPNGVQRASDEEKMSLGFALVLEVIQRGWAGWILKRMREATDMKPKQWTELHAGLECLTQVLLLVDAMSSSKDEDLQDAAGTLQYQIYYNGEALERMLECMRTYKDQSFGYLEANIHLAYVLLRMLERWGSKNGGLYIRKTKKKKGAKQTTGVPEEEGVVDDVSEEDTQMNEDVLQEMTLEKFEHKFANEEVTVTLLAYLSKFQEFDSPEKMKWVVALMHRQAVRAKAEGLYFKVSTLALFQVVLAHQKTLPRERSYKDLVSLITYLLRQFFKGVASDPMLIAEAFLPKNRGMWKAYSSWEPPEKKRKGDKDASRAGIDSDDDAGPSHLPPDVRVKRGHSWSERLGIAIACLCEKEERQLVEWTKGLLRLIIDVKQMTIDEVDKTEPEIEMDPDGEEVVKNRNMDGNPSEAALSKLEDFVIPCTEESHVTAVTLNPHLKLLFNLIGFKILDPTATKELEWVCPKEKLPADLQRSLNLINNFLLDPLDLGGKKALQMISKPPKRKTKRVRPPVSDDDANGSNLDDDIEGDKEARSRKKGAARGEKNKKEKESVLSAQFIEDSDQEIGNDDNFFAAEAALRQRMAAAAESGKGPSVIKKKRKKLDGSEHNDSEDGGTRKRARKDNAPKQAGSTRSDTLDLSSDEGITPMVSQRRSSRDGGSASDRSSGSGEHAKKPRRSPTSSPPPASSRAASSGGNSEDEEASKVPSSSSNLKRLSRSSGVLDFEDSELEEDSLPVPRKPGGAVRPVKRRLVSDEDDD